MDNQIYIQEIIKKLLPINPEMILLFGSYAYGTPHEDSDIDILVVTNDKYMPQNFDERLNLELSVSNIIHEIARKVPIDLLVYTKPMFEKFIKLNSSFAQEITTKGKKLYEKNNAGMA